MENVYQGINKCQLSPKRMVKNKSHFPHASDPFETITSKNVDLLFETGATRMNKYKVLLHIIL